MTQEQKQERCEVAVYSEVVSFQLSQVEVKRERYLQIRVPGDEKDTWEIIEIRVRKDGSVEVFADKPLKVMTWDEWRTVEGMLF